jgi:arylsulfatase A-like enzyme
VNLHVSAQNSATWQSVSSKGLNPDETTIAEVFQPAGYATVCIGKWQLGDQLPCLPIRKGIDSCCGVPYGDDRTTARQNEGEISGPPPSMARVG